MKPYTQLSKPDLQQILRQFDLSPVTEFRALEGGAENSNYVLTTEQRRYVLTLCERKTLTETEALANLLVHLERHQFLTTQIIRNNSGDKVSAFQRKPILLKSFLPGQVLKELSSDLLYNIGASIGRLHQIPAPDYLPKNYSYGIQTFQQLQEAKINHPFVTWLADKADYIRANMHPDLPRSLIHGDVFCSNVVVSKQGMPVIMDFEEACHYYRIYDVGMAIVGLCLLDGKVILSKVHQLIAGYQTEVVMESLEQERLKAFTIYAATATAFWRFRQFRLIMSDEVRQNDYLAMKMVADQVYNIPTQELIGKQV